MFIATNFGIFEIGKRPQQFIPEGDDRNLQVRSRSFVHLHRLREKYLPTLGETVILDKPTDFQYRAYLTKDQLAEMLAALADEVTYEQFKHDALDDKLYKALSAMWTAWLRFYPKGSMWGDAVSTKYVD